MPPHLFSVSLPGFPSSELWEKEIPALRTWSEFLDPCALATQRC